MNKNNVVKKIWGGYALYYEAVGMSASLEEHILESLAKQDFKSASKFLEKAGIAIEGAKELGKALQSPEVEYLMNLYNSSDLHFRFLAAKKQFEEYLADRHADYSALKKAISLGQRATRFMGYLTKLVYAIDKENYEKASELRDKLIEEKSKLIKRTEKDKKLKAALNSLDKILKEQIE